MFPWLGDALMAALESALGERWTPRMESAWRNAFESVALIMIEGARAALAAERADGVRYARL